MDLIMKIDSDRRPERRRRASLRGPSARGGARACLLAMALGIAAPTFAQNAANESTATQSATTTATATATPSTPPTPAVAAPADAAPLGRLFLTPDQRRALDELRDRKPQPAPVAIAPQAQPEVEPAAPEPEAEPEPPVVSELTVNGIILRKNGLSAAWVNGAPILNGSMTREGVVVRTGRGGVRMVMPGGESTLRLKPGQKVDVANGSVLEAYQLPREGSEEADETALIEAELERLRPSEPASVSPESPDESAPGSSEGTSARQLLDDLFSRLR